MSFLRAEKLRLHLACTPKGRDSCDYYVSWGKNSHFLGTKHQRPSRGLSCILSGCTFKGSVTKIHFRVDFSTVTIFQQNTIGLEPFGASDGFVCVRERESERKTGREKGRGRSNRESVSERVYVLPQCPLTVNFCMHPLSAYLTICLFLFATEDHDLCWQSLWI